ncbi:MAG: hypothetical protein AAF950_06880 [Pseudomonadota bacterium]
MTEKRIIFVFNDAELHSPALIREARNLAALKMPEPRRGRDFLCNLLRDLDDVNFINAVGQIIEVDLAVFGVSDHEIDIGDAARINELIADWFEYTCQPVPDDITSYVQAHTRERFRVLATILIAAYPEEVKDWPRIIPANDNWVLEAANASNHNREDKDGDEQEEI